MARTAHSLQIDPRPGARRHRLLHRHDELSRRDLARHPLGRHVAAALKAPVFRCANRRRIQHGRFPSGARRRAEPGLRTAPRSVGVRTSSSAAALLGPTSVFDRPACLLRQSRRPASSARGNSAMKKALNARCSGTPGNRSSKRATRWLQPGLSHCRLTNACGACAALNRRSRFGDSSSSGCSHASWCGSGVTKLHSVATRDHCAALRPATPVVRALLSGPGEVPVQPPTRSARGFRTFGPGGLSGAALPASHGSCG